MEGRTRAALDLRLDMPCSRSEVMPRPTELSSSSSAVSPAPAGLPRTCDLRLYGVQAGLVAQLVKLRSVQTEVCVDDELRTESSEEKWVCCELSL